jgi:hypothetical protein
MIRDVLNQTVSPLDGTFLAEISTDILPGLNLRLNDAFAGIGFHDSFRWNCKRFHAPGCPEAETLKQRRAGL